MKYQWFVKAFLFLTIALSGCSTTKNYDATGGSRSDGTIKLSYEYGGFEKPVVNSQQGVELAKSRCAAWGYSGAEAFGGGIRNCIASNAYGCNRYRVTTEYQCLGRPEK